MRGICKSLGTYPLYFCDLEIGKLEKKALFYIYSFEMDTIRLGLK